MARFFDSIERRLLAALSLLLSITAFFFIAREVDKMMFLAISRDTTLFYVLFAVIGVLVAGIIAYLNERFDWLDWLGKLLITFFPTEVLFIFGLTQSANFHYIVFLAAGLYIVFVGIALIGLRHRAVSKRARTFDKELGRPGWLRRQRLWRLSFVALITLTYLGFGLHGIQNFAAVDEPLWTYDRIPNFWKDISQRDWYHASVSDKPGVTVAYLSGIGLMEVNPKEYREKYWNNPVWQTTHDIRDMNFPLRAPILVFTALMLPLFYFLIERSLGRMTALIATALIGTQPILLGMARIINPDSLLWTFAPLSLLGYLAYRKRRNLWYLYLSGILLGFALLTKYVANIILVFLLGFIFLEYIFLKKKERETVSPQDFFKEKLRDYLFVTFAALATFYLLYPLVWVKPDKLLDATLLSEAFAGTWPLFIGLILFVIADYSLFKNRVTAGILDVLSEYRQYFSWAVAGGFFICLFIVIWNVWSSSPHYDFQEIITSPKSSYAQAGFSGIFFANFYPLFFGIVPIALIGLIISTARLFFRSISRTSVQITLALIILIFLYYLGAAINHVAMMNRYQIMLYPVALIVAAIGLKELSTIIRRIPLLGQHPLAWNATFVIGIFFVSLWSLWSVRPHYLAYASDILPDRYYIDVKDMGSGSYEAAEYLNTLPDATTLTVWTDKTGVCAFFIGKCYSTFNFENLATKKIDYVVVSAGRKSRTTKMIQGAINSGKFGVIRFDAYYNTPSEQADFIVHPGGRLGNYVKVIRPN